MNRIHLLLTLSSLNVLLVTLERYSFTTKIVLQPFSFLRLHEVIQMTVIILFTVIIPCFLFKEVSDNFSLLKKKSVQLWGMIFIIGIYFYATGNGLHEVASYLFNTYCPVKTFTSTLCGSMFFNDFYTGNVLYFIGAYLMNGALIAVELIGKKHAMKKKDAIFVIINSLFYGLAICAYAAFDRVLVGLVYSLISMITVDIIFLFSRMKYRSMPLITYFAIAYTLGTCASLIVRFK